MATTLRPADYGQVIFTGELPDEAPSPAQSARAVRRDKESRKRAKRLKKRASRRTALIVACSEYWAEAKSDGHEIPSGQPFPNHLVRDHRIYPTTTCRCRKCNGRRQWPNNAYVSAAGFAYDCVLQDEKPDPDLEEELEKLRGGSASFIDQHAMKSAHRRSQSYRGG